MLLYVVGIVEIVFAFPFLDGKFIALSYLIEPLYILAKILSECEIAGSGIDVNHDTSESIGDTFSRFSLKLEETYGVLFANLSIIVCDDITSNVINFFYPINGEFKDLAFNKLCHCLYFLG